MSLNRILLCSKLRNGPWKIVTKSQVVTKCNVTKSRLHCTCQEKIGFNQTILNLFSLYLPDWFDIFQMGLSSWLYQERKGGYCPYYWWWIRNWKAYVAQIGWFRSNYCYMGCQCQGKWRNCKVIWILHFIYDLSSPKNHVKSGF